MDRTSTAEHQVFLAGALAMLDAVPGVAILVGQDGAVLGGNARMRDTIRDNVTATLKQDDWQDLLNDVLGTSQSRFNRLTFPDGTQIGFYCQRFEVPGQPPCILLREDRPPSGVAARHSPTKLLRIEDEKQQALAEKQRLEKEAQHWRKVSMTDRMTGLLNSTGFRDSAGAVIDSGHRAVLVYADLNGFKQVNDTLGHAAGDKLLCDMAQTLTMATRATDLVGRVGGDEFAILLTDCSEANRDAVMRRLQDAMARRFPVDRGPGQPVTIIRVSAAMGYAVYPDEAQDIDSLMLLADKRMYSDKRGADQRRAQG